MSAIEAAVPTTGPLAQLRSVGMQTWRELPRVVAVGTLAVVAAAPVAVAALGAAPAWLLALAALPVALIATGLARVGAVIADGDRVRVRDGLRVDPLLALVILATATAAAWLVSQDGAPQLVGFAVAGAGLLILPRALAYGAVRGRTGLAAVRGGAILAAYRPGSTIAQLSLGVLGAFAIAASLGTLALVVPALLAAFAARVTADELRAIDAAQGVAR